MIIKNVKGARRYSFNDKDSGRLVEGINVFYERESRTADEIGIQTEKVSLPIGAWGDLNNLTFPVDCEAEIIQELGGKQGVKTKVVGLKPLRK